MAYTTTTGIKESALPAWLKQAAKDYGTFGDGRVNYRNAPIAPIVMCTVICRDELLLVKRGQRLADAQGYWSTVNGFIDEPQSVAAQAQQEVRKELGLVIATSAITVRSSYTLQNSQEKRRYIVFPCLIALDSKPAIVLNEEHTEYVWIRRAKFETYDILDDLPYAIDSALGE